MFKTLKNGAVFGLLTKEQAEYWFDTIDVFVLHDDGTKSLVESADDIKTAVKNFEELGYELGSMLKNSEVIGTHT